MTIKPLDDGFLQKHARPGEDWDQARNRLDGEIFERYRKLPACEVCADGAISLERSAFTHSVGGCAERLETWPAEAMDKRLFDAAHAQSALHTRALAAMARSEMNRRVDHIRFETNPINVPRFVHEAKGYLKACEQFCLFSQAELDALAQELFLLNRHAELACGKNTEK